MMPHASFEEAIKANVKTSSAVCPSAPTAVQEIQTLITRNVHLLSSHNLPKETLTTASLPVLRIFFYLFILTSDYL